ncbi:MAG: dual specificity protein phosphatase family protein [Burkholderiales bacterium]|nr:dual specificity protein phosphatase family protein [Burkholderiales bacterium]
MDWITHEIAIGNCDDALRLDVLRDAGISGILSLTGWPNNANNVHGIDWRCVELIDGEGNDVIRLKQALGHLHTLVTTRGNVLVHCMEGVSRSPLVVASYLADTAGREFDACLHEVAQARGRLNIQPGLLDLRRAYEVAFKAHERVFTPALGPALLLASD